MNKMRFILKNMLGALSANDKEKVIKLVKKYNLYFWNPPLLAFDIEWSPLDCGNTIYSNHLWRDEVVETIETPTELPRLEHDIHVEDKWIKLELNYVNKRSGGMGSFFGYEGYYLSLIVSLDELIIIDARGIKAH